MFYETYYKKQTLKQTDLDEGCHHHNPTISCRETMHRELHKHMSDRFWRDVQCLPTPHCPAAVVLYQKPECPPPVTLRRALWFQNSTRDAALDWFPLGCLGAFNGWTYFSPTR